VPPIAVQLRALTGDDAEEDDPIEDNHDAEEMMRADGDQHAGIGSGQHALALLPVIGMVIALLTMIMMIVVAARTLSQ